MAEMRDRLRRLKTSCDFYSDHKDESWQTLCLICVIVFFKLNGGKAEWIGVYMTTFLLQGIEASTGLLPAP